MDVSVITMDFSSITMDFSSITIDFSDVTMDFRNPNYGQKKSLLQPVKKQAAGGEK